MKGVQTALLSGGRLHLQHGPIDLIIGAEGKGRVAAYAAACDRFMPLLDELVSELPHLRSEVTDKAPELSVARRMWAATRPHKPAFITPMAAVAGAVADEVLSAMVEASPEIDKIFVNNGGDIALHLSNERTSNAAIAAPDNTVLGRVTIRERDPIRGIATSGQGGRSFSLGIADSVTVLARNAAAADAAATLIANAVDLPDHPAIRRCPACELDPEQELGPREVTVSVGKLPPSDIEAALENGLKAARAMRGKALISGAFLFLQGETRILSPDAALT